MVGGVEPEGLGEPRSRRPVEDRAGQRKVVFVLQSGIIAWLPILVRGDGDHSGDGTQGIDSPIPA